MSSESGLSLGLATHISWALNLTEAQAAEMLTIVAQWDDMGEGREAFARCESPAERLFLLGFLLSDLEVDWTDYAEFARPPAPPTPDYVFVVSCNNFHVQICNQVETAGYRVDFLATAWLGGEVCPLLTTIAVEIDGHDYHERTKEQAARDRRRDRELLRNGVITVRFTAAEVHANPAGCAVETIRLVESLAVEAAKLERQIETSYQRGREAALEELTSPAPPLLPAAREAAE
jgi:very-short-patch-repair endonuclease